MTRRLSKSVQFSIVFTTLLAGGLSVGPLAAQSAVDAPAVPDSAQPADAKSAANPAAAESAAVSAGNSAAAAATAEVAVGDNVAVAIDLTLSERLLKFEDDLAADRASARDATTKYNVVRDYLRVRLWQMAMALDNGDLPSSPAIIDPALLEQQHPGFPGNYYQLPNGVRTIEDLYANLREFYAVRMSLLQLAEAAVRAQVAGTEKYGLQELRAEKDMILIEFRYQARHFPALIHNFSALATWKPVAAFWLLIQIWFTLAVFRWWRGWLPGTLARTRANLLAVRPRTDEIITRLRVLWYFNQIRTPVEWMALFIVLISIPSFTEFNFALDIVSIILRWVMLAWFSVAVLNAIATRSAVGAAGEVAALRLRSMRLVAGWIVAAGLGLALTDYLVGQASIYVWVKRLLELAAVPVVLRLLGLWHMELYFRLQRETDPDIPAAEYAAQRGWRKWRGSVHVASLLAASWLRGVVVQRMERFGSALTAGGSDAGLSEDESAFNALPAVTREQLIDGYDVYSRYARTDRRALVRRINSGTSSVVFIVGERGIGKGGFIRQVADAHDYGSVIVDCRSGDYATLRVEFVRQLGLPADADIAAVNAALLEKNIRFIAFNDVHFLVRPVMGGFNELSKLAELQVQIKLPLVWAVSIDRYAYQLIVRGRAAYATAASTIIDLPAWSEEQIGDFIEQRCATVGIAPDFGKIRVPRQYMDTAQDAIEERNRAGAYAMITALARGNPAIAIRLFADCLNVQADGTLEVTVPDNLDVQAFDTASIHTLLVLRVIAQAESISYADIVASLRFDESLVQAILYRGVLRGWLDQDGDRYQLSWNWFRTITRVLARRNLLAGVSQESM